MRPKLKEELEYALWKITGTPLQFNEHVIACLSREMASKTGEDSAEISLRLIEQIQQIVNEDIDQQMKKCRQYAHPVKT